MNLTAIFIAALNLVQPQAQINLPTTIPTCQSLSKEMDTTLARRDLDSLEMDQALRQPRLQYMKMNCKNGKPASSTDIIFNMLSSGMVDAPQFNGIDFGTRGGLMSGIATEATKDQGQYKNNCNSLLSTHKCEHTMNENEDLLGINAVDNIL